MRSLLLAGGKSSRMGQDKAMIKIEGEYCISRIVNALYSSDSEPIRIVVSDIKYIEKYGKIINSEIELDWFVDSNQYAGPIEAIIENFEDNSILKEDLIQLATVDVPWVTNDFFNCLRNSIGDNDDLLMPTDGVKKHPLLSLVRPKVVLNKLKKGSKKPLFIQFSELECSSYLEDFKILKNINYPHDIG